MTRSPLNETLSHHTGQEPDGEVDYFLGEQGEDALTTLSKTHHSHCFKAAAATVLPYGVNRGGI